MTLEAFPCKRLLLPHPPDDQHFFHSDYTLNLYRGCNHGCIYCDSRSVCYHMEDFGRVRVKAGCLAKLEGELRAKRSAGVVAMGAACDAYNAFERDAEITRGALLLLRRYGFGVGIPTKSDLIARDADVLGDMARSSTARVAFSVTTADDALAAKLEPHAPSPSRRFAAMRALADAGVCVGTWMNPMLPFLTDTADNVRDTLRATADAGGRFAICHFDVTLREGDREYFYAALDREPAFAGVKGRYVDAFGLDYLCPTPNRAPLAALFDDECERLGLVYRFADVNRLSAQNRPRQQTFFDDGL